MNKLLAFLLLSLLPSQSQNNLDNLEKIRNNIRAVNIKKENPIEEKFLQAKSLERAGLYEEAFSLFKEINRDHPGINKYFQPELMEKNAAEKFYNTFRKRCNKILDPDIYINKSSYRKEVTKKTNRVRWENRLYRLYNSLKCSPIN